MSYVEKTNLADSTGLTINPATAENQEIFVLLRQLLTAIAYPNTVDRSLNAQRITGTLPAVTTVTTVSTVTTCTTVTGVTNLDGYQAKLPVINNNTAAWALAVRARIS